jgi:hypothetical protein
VQIQLAEHLDKSNEAHRSSYVSCRSCSIDDDDDDNSSNTKPRQEQNSWIRVTNRISRSRDGGARSPGHLEEERGGFLAAMDANVYRPRIMEILKTADLETVSAKSIRKTLQQRTTQDLSAFKVGDSMSWRVC